MRPSRLLRRFATPLRRILSLLLALVISGAPNLAAVTAAYAAEFVAVEIVAGVPGGAVRINPGATTGFPIQLTATGMLHPSISAWVQIPTFYRLNSAGVASAMAPGPQWPFWRGVGGVATWSGYPAPYVVGATLQVDPGCPVGTYTIPISPVINTSTAPSNNFEDLTVDTITVIVGDTVPPTTMAALVGTLGDSGWYRSDVTVNLTGNDGIGTGIDYTEYSRDAGATWTRGSSALISDEGVTTLYYRSRDLAGNVQSPAGQVTVKIDKSAPALSFSNLLDGDAVRQIAPETGYSDPVSGIAVSSFAVTLDGAPYFGGTIDAEGSHTLVASVADAAGNRAVHSATFFVDRTNPTVTITNPADNGAYRTPQAFAYAVDDNSGGAIVTPDPALGYIWTTEGLWFGTVSATDGAGNTGTDGVSFMIDTTAPRTGADLSGSLDSSGWYLSPVTVALNADDPLSGGVASGVSSTWISLDGAAAQPYVYDSPVTVTGDGEHTVSFHSVDAAGNSEPAGTSSFLIDTVAPTAAIGLTGTSGTGGWYTSSVVANLTGTDATSKIDRFEYELNGHGWVDYTEPLVLTDGTNTLRARSYDKAGNVSDIAEKTVRVDTIAPSAAIALTGTSGLSGWFTTAVLAELSAEDGTAGLARIEYELDGGGWSPYSETLVLGDGTTTLRGRSVDEAGNVSEVAQEIVKVDTAAPHTECAADRAPDHDGWYTEPVTLTLSASDAASGVDKTLYSLDGSTWAEYTDPLTINDPGTTSVWFYSTDSAGNTEPPDDPHAVSLDRSDPEPWVSGVTEGDWVFEATVGFGANDPTPGSGLDSVVARLDGVAIPDGFVADTEGEHELVVTATDKAGRSASTSVNFTIDRSAPDITIVNPADGGTYNLAQIFDFTVSDADPLVAVTPNPAKGHTWDAEGAYSASVEARDRAGNSASKSIAFIIDTTAPQTDAHVISGVVGEAGWWKSAVTIDLTALDPVSGGTSTGVAETWYRLDGGAWTQGTSLDVADEGMHAVEFYSVDRAGNTEAAGGLLEFGIDVSKPDIKPGFSGTLGAPASGYYVSDVSVDAKVADAISGPAGWQYRLDDADEWADFTGSLTLRDGVWNLQMRPLDVAGNIGDAVTHTIRVDTVAPETASTADRAPDHNGWYTGAVTITLDATDGGSGVDKTFYSFDGSTWDEYTAPLAIADPGTTSVWFYSTDSAGNTEDSNDPHVVSVDLSNPEPWLSGASEGDWVYETTVGFGADDPTPGSGVGSVVALLDGVAVPDGYVASGEGPHTLVVTATDVSGRTASTSVNFTIDRSAPAITITNPADGGKYNTSQTFDFLVDDADPLVAVVPSPAKGHVWIAEGAYSASVEARDRAGNADSKGIAFIIDTSAPLSDASVITGTPGLSGWWKSGVTVGLSAVDPQSGGVSSGVAETWYRVDGGDLTKGTSVPVVTEGIHEVAYFSVDAAGNREPAKAFEVKIDLSAPYLTVAGPVSTTYLYGSTFTAQFSAADGCSGMLCAPTATFNGTALANGQTLALTTAGANTFVARATDCAGNECAVTVPITVAFAAGDILPPGAIDNTWNAGRTMPVKFTVLDASGKPTSAANAMVDVKLQNAAGVTQVANGPAYVSNENGACFYHFNVKTIKGQAGTLKVTITLNDGVTVMRKDIYLR